MNDTITKEITRLLEQDTFSAKAVEGIKSLRDRVADLETEVTNKSGTLRETIAQMGSMEDRLTELRDERNELKAKLDSLKEREATQVELETRVAVSDAKAAALAYAMETVFKPAELRRQAWSTHNQNYGSDGSTTYSPEVSREETETST